MLASDGWMGGRNYLRNLFAAIRILHGTPITPVLFTGTQQSDVAPDFPGVEIIQASILDRRSPASLGRKLIVKATGRDIVLRRLFRRHSVDVLSHAFRIDGQTGVKTIGWVPDFQHVHLPEFFTAEERAVRDSEYLELGSRCDKLIVSSECALADFRAFSPQDAHKAELLHFVASPVPTGHAAKLSDLQQQYDFQRPYFLLPNQFWAHKNHRVVVSALQLLKRRDESFLVLATGATEDHRNPSFFPSLMQYAAECDVLDRFQVLGQIPFDHLVGLMQHAIAFINPSRFEGWSTSVEEAKSMGKSIVLSDIPVHREQAPERGIFFPANDPEALGAAMTTAYNEFDARHDVAMQDQARAQFPERQRRFAEAYRDIVKNASQHHGSSV
jgi:glycosyltransferase involved in cell wall biosynthesis